MTATTHMATEVAQAPEVVARMLDTNRLALAELGQLVRRHAPTHFVTCARGSSDHAASYFKYLSELSLGLPCCSVGASVVSIYGTRLNLRNTLLISISQSGRSPDLLAFQAEAKRGGTPTIAITNDADSPLAQQADICLLLCAGPELSVAATKTFIASAALAAAIVGACFDDASLANAVQRLPQDLAATAALRWTELEEAAANAQSLFVLGRGPSLPMAQEAALKLKETSGLHAEAYSAAEVLHGPMELVQPGFPVLVFATRDVAAATTAATTQRLAEAGARLLQVPFQNTSHPALDPIAMIQTFYAAAERLARLRGRNPDTPRLLKKVTQTL